VARTLVVCAYFMSSPLDMEHVPSPKTFFLALVECLPTPRIFNRAHLPLLKRIFPPVSLRLVTPFLFFVST